MPEVSILAVRKKEPTHEVDVLSIRPGQPSANPEVPAGSFGQPDPLSFDESKSLLTWTPPMKELSPELSVNRNEPGLQGDAFVQMLNVPMLPGFITSAAAKGAGEGLANLGGKSLTPEAEMLLAQGQPAVESAVAGGDKAAALATPAGGFASILRAPGIREIGPRGISESTRAGAVGAAAAGTEALLKGKEESFSDLKRKALNQALGITESQMPQDMTRTVKLKNGDLINTPSDFKGDHGDLLNSFGIKLEEVESIGWTKNGKYIPKDTLPGIRPEKFATPEEQATAEKIIQAIPDDAFKAANRGVVTDQSALEAARNSGWSKEMVLDLPIGSVLKKEDSFKVTGVFVSEINKLNKLQLAWDKAMADGEKEEITDALSSALLQQRVDVIKLGIKRSATATEAGRSLQALKSQYEGIETASLDLAQKLSKQTPAVKEWALKRLQEVGNDPDEVRKVMQKLSGWSWTRMGLEAVNAMRLTGVPSWIVGAATQTGRKILDVPMRAIAGVIDTVGDPLLKKIYGEERQRWVGEAWADVQGMLDGISAGARQAAKTLGSEAETMRIAEKRGFTTNVAIKGRPGKDTMFDNFLDFIGPKIRLGYRPYAAVDNGLKPIFEQGSYRAFVYRQAMQDLQKVGVKPTEEAIANEVEKRLANPSFKLLEAADKDSEMSMFRQTAPQSVAYWNRLRRAAPLVEFFDPFVTTAVNAFREGARAMPGLGLLTPHNLDIIKAGQRGPMVDLAAKQMLGALTLWPFIKMAADKKINTDAPKDPWENYKFYASGRQPNSLEINGHAVTFNRLSPFAEWPVTAKLLVDAIQNKNQKAISDQVGGFIGGQGKNFVDKTFMKGISDVIEAVEDQKRFGGKFIRDTISGALIPSILGYGARAADAVVRQPKTVTGAIKSRIPGLSDEVIPKRGIFGEEMQRPGGSGLAGKAMRFASPVQISKIVEDPVIAALDKQGLRLHYPSPTINKRPLLPEEVDFISAQSGPILKQVVQAELANPSFQEKLPTEKKRRLEAVEEQVRAPFREKFVVPAELRALKFDPAQVSNKAQAAIYMFMKAKGTPGPDGKVQPNLYNLSFDDAWKRSVIQAILDSNP